MSMKSTVQINLSVFGIAILLSFLGVEKVNADEIRTPVKYRNDNRSKPIAKKNLQSATKQDLTVDAPPINGVDEELKQKEIKKLPDAGKAASVPFDFQFAKSPSKFANVLDLSDFRYHNLPFEPLLAGSMNVLGAQTARMEVSTVGAQLGMYESNSREKSDIGSEKYVQLMNGLGFFAIYPTKIGLRLAGAFSQSDGSFKAEDSTSSEGGFKIKLKSQIIGVSVAGFLENGFGAAIRVSNFSEDLSGSYESGGRTFEMRSRDATYSHIQPQLMLNKEFGEFVFSWDRRLDHETAPKFGFYKLEYESRSAPMSGVLEVSRFRSSEGEGGNRDSWFLRGGVRHIFNDGQSNLKALLAVNDAFYIEPVDADPFSVSQLGVHVSGESVFSSNHLLSYGLAYGLGQGKGKTSRQIKTTLTQNSLALRAGYRLQLN